MEIKKYLESLRDKEYKGYATLPFWVWNDKLEKEKLIGQVKRMHDCGFGGFFIHARAGLTTEYLGKEWMEFADACIKQASFLGMQGWIYDENGWPSGFVGGKLLIDEDNRDRFLTYGEGAFDSAATLCYDLSGDKLVRAYKDEGKRYLNIYEHVSVSTVDILNPEVVDKFIFETHENYKKNLMSFNGELVGFFTDEPQYYRWAHPYTVMLERYFRDEYGEDIKENLGLMFVEKEGYRAFRYKYWKAMQTLMLENFSKKIYDWCINNGKLFTGHYVEETSLEFQMMCCGGVMPYYMYQSIPGVDKLGRVPESPVAFKQASSVCRQLGKKKLLTESFACCGWDVTPLELKKIVDSQFVNGVNILCQHLVPYSEKGQRKREYPAHFADINPWVKKDFKSFNEYVMRLGYFIGESKEIVSVAVFNPIRSVYFDYKRDKLGSLYESIDKYYIELTNKLSEMNIPYHIVDETVMAKYGRVENGFLIVGECSYDTVIFPKLYTMDRNTKLLFDEFYKNGGKMMFTENLPEWVEGEPCEYNYESNVTLSEIAAAQIYRIEEAGGDIRSTLREIDGNKFIFATNLGDFKQSITFSGDFKSFYAYDLQDMTCRITDKKVTLQAGESVLLFLSDERADIKQELEQLVLTGPFEVTSVSDNYFTLDKLAYSVDGLEYSEVKSWQAVFNDLLEKRFSGELYLRYPFSVKEKPRRIKFLSEDMNTIKAWINGKEIIFDGVSDMDDCVLSSDITDLVIEGENSAVLKINFFEKENVYYALYGDNVTEGLVNCLVFDTTIEACYLQGDFGVYSESGFYVGKEQNVWMSDGGFYIGKKKDKITDTVTDGYPFFSGNITLRKEFDFKGDGCELVLKGRYHLAYIKINGKKVDKKYFSDRVDITKYLKKGKNEAEITLYSACRNLLGPHHFKDKEEPKHVGTVTFDFIGTYKDGKSYYERDNYSFVKFGLFDD